MKKTRLALFAALYCAFTIAAVEIAAQTSTTVRLLYDQAHGEQPPPGPMDAIAKKLGLEIQTSAQPINAESLKGVRILYLRAPSKEFAAAETEAIVAFVKGGGSLLLVLDEERSAADSTSSTSKRCSRSTSLSRGEIPGHASKCVNVKQSN
jgi:hypothetical protein